MCSYEFDGLFEVGRGAAADLWALPKASKSPMHGTHEGPFWDSVVGPTTLNLRAQS